MYVCVRELADSDKPFGSGSDVPNSAARACFLIKKRKKRWEVYSRGRVWVVLYGGVGGDPSPLSLFSADHSFN